MTTLLVGRGLLGSAVVRVLRLRGEDVRLVDVPWSSADAVEVLLEAARATAATDPQWRLAWCAGAGVIATAPETLAAELETFERVVDGLTAGPAPAVLFLASSAGGLYAGSSDEPPYSESSPVRPLAPYGHTKAGMETAVTRLAERAGTRVAIGRIANLYGPGQDLTKPQGLISQLCLSQLTRQPLTIYASLDTLRDYVYVDDAARLVVGCLDRAAAAPAGEVTVKVVASGQALSVGALISVTSRAFRRRPRLVMRPVPSPARDLRLTSRVWPELDRIPHTPLPVGLRATADDISAQQRRGLLPAGAR